MKISKLENKVRSAIKDAIWEYETEEDENVTNIKMMAELNIDTSGEHTLMLDIFELDE